MRNGIASSQGTEVSRGVLTRGIDDITRSILSRSHLDIVSSAARNGRVLIHGGRLMKFAMVHVASTMRARVFLRYPQKVDGRGELNRMQRWVNTSNAREGGEIEDKNKRVSTRWGIAGARSTWT